MIDQLESSLDEGRVDVVELHERPRWLLAVLQTASGRRLFAKMPNPDGRDPVNPRPRLVSVSPRAERLRSEADALRRLSEAIPDDDPHLGAVSVVHWQEAPTALVVDFVVGQPLSTALSVRGRRSRRSSDLLEVAGRWLRLFHSLTDEEPVAYRYPDDVVKWLDSVDHFLSGETGSKSCRRLVDELAGAIERTRLEPPRLGLHHGDMAARNLMIRADGRLVGIDAGVSWQAPRAHDLGVFVSDLQLRSLQGHRRGDRFLEGYGDRSEDDRTSDIFFSMAVVDRYVAWRGRQHGQGPGRWRWRVEGARLDRMVRRVTDQLRGL